MPIAPYSRARSAFGRLYLWAADRLYHEFAPLYDVVAWLVSGGRWAEWRRIALDYVRGPVVLELGFGTGVLLGELAECWPSVIGVDASREMQRVSRRNLAHHGLGARQPARVRARTQRIPLHDACCDSLVSTFPAPYIVDPATLAEAARVLRPAGRMIVVGLVVHADRRERRKHPELALHLHPPGEPAVEQFCRLAEDIGLQVRRLSRFDPPVRLPILIVERQA
jgi:ubiquinone/menaquinone biosynthesis C-methylase UbiE